jgi:hypothetical protein
MIAPRLTLAVLVYVTLDLSSPFVAGAFTFNPDDCVDAVHRTSLASQRADEPPPDRAPAVRRDPVVSPARPLAWRNAANVAWLADSGVSHRASGDPPLRPSSDDH